MHRFFALALTLAFPVSIFAQEAKTPAKDKLHIYLLVGQSNMSGRAKVEAEDQQIPANLFLLDSKGSWVAATHPFVQYTNVPNSADISVIKNGGKNGLNFGLTFGRKILASADVASVGLIVNSQGGSAIKTWLRGGHNYVKTMERVKAAQGSGIIKGILWHQGESDQKMAEAYLDPLAKVIGQFREDLGDAKLPFVAGQIAPLPKEKAVIDAFNQALLKLPERVPNTAVVRTDGFKGDDIHFGSAETRRLGEMYAEQMLKLQAK